MFVKPRLKADTIALFNLYHQNQVVTAKDIKRVFGVADSTSRRAIHCVIEHMKSKGIQPYTYELEVPVHMLFDLYGWDIRQINKSAKVLHNFGGFT